MVVFGRSIPDWMRQIDLEKVLKLLGIELLRSTGQGNWQTRCPFPEHDDNNPSFSICLDDGPKKGVWHCFRDGGGSLVHLVMRLKNLGAKEAKNWLLGTVALDVELEVASIGELKKRVAEEDHDVDETSLVIPMPGGEQDFRVFSRYLENVRGYPPRIVNEILATLDEERVPWVVPQHGYYRERVVVPLFLSNGVQTSFMAQALDPQNPPTSLDDPKPKLFPSGAPVRYMLFGNLWSRQNWCIVVEGLWDCLYLRALGLPAVCVHSCNVSDHQQTALIQRYSRVYFLFDGDPHLPVGKRGIDKAAKIAQQMCGYVQTIIVPVPTDPDECIRSLNDARALFRRGWLVKEVAAAQRRPSERQNAWV